MYVLLTKRINTEHLDVQLMLGFFMLSFAVGMTNPFLDPKSLNKIDVMNSLFLVSGFLSGLHVWIRHEHEKIRFKEYDESLKASNDRIATLEGILKNINQTHPHLKIPSMQKESGNDQKQTSGQA